MTNEIERRGPYIVTERRIGYENPWIRVIEDKVIRPDGMAGIFGILEVGRGRGGVAVLPISSSGKVFLVEEFVYARNETTIEVLSGGIEDGEDPLFSAKRELQEELGIEARTWDDLGRVSHMTTIVRSNAHMFLARDFDERLLVPEPGLKIVHFSLEDAIDRAMSGEFISSTTCCILLKAYVKLTQKR